MLYRGAKSPIVRDMGGFKVRLNMPGWLLPWPRDHGYGPLAMVAETILDPGRLVAMHEHRNDEILSWVPEGVMRHDDRATGRLVTDRAHLMVMNAGQSFWHSEETLSGDPPLRMLQILVRPHSVDLPPNIQYGPIEPAPLNCWRHLVGAEGGGSAILLPQRHRFLRSQARGDGKGGVSPEGGEAPLLLCVLRFGGSRGRPV
ncbi:pirin family protein [Ensifer adhaerens]